MAGRKIFLGWAYFVSSGEGHDWDARRAIMNKMLSPNNEALLCHALEDNKISFVEIGQNSDDPVAPKFDQEFFAKRYKPQFVSPDQKLQIYATSDICAYARSL